MSNITITIDSAQVDAMLSHLTNRLDNLQPVLEAIGRTIKGNILLTFTDLKTPDGTPWKPLSPVTKFNRALRTGGRKRFDSSGSRIANSAYTQNGSRTVAKFTRDYLSATPLNDTGVLRNSIAYQLTGQAVEIGTNAPQAAMMNFGGTKAQFGHLWGDIPARQFMPMQGLPVRWEQDMIDVLENYLV